MAVVAMASKPMAMTIMSAVLLWLGVVRNKSAPPMSTLGWFTEARPAGFKSKKLGMSAAKIFVFTLTPQVARWQMGGAPPSFEDPLFFIKQKDACAPC